MATKKIEVPDWVGIWLVLVTMGVIIGLIFGSAAHIALEKRQAELERSLEWSDRYAAGLQSQIWDLQRKFEPPSNPGCVVIDKVDMHVSKTGPGMTVEAGACLKLTNSVIHGE